MAQRTDIDAREERRSLAPSRPEAFAWMAGSATAYALMNLFARVASEHVHWTMVACVRSIVGAAVAYAVARARRAPTVVKNRRGIWVRSAFGTLALLLTFYALGTPLPLGDTTTLLNLSPVFLALLGPVLLGERAGKRVAIAMPLSLVGVVLIVRPEVVTGMGALTGAAAAVGSALCASFSYATIRRMGPGESSEAIALHFSLVAAAVLTVLAALHASVPDLLTLGAMLGAGACGGFAQIALTRAYAIERAARVSSLSYLAVLVSAALGAVLLHEWPTPRAIAGMVLIVAGGLVVTLAGLRDKR